MKTDEEIIKYIAKHKKDSKDIKKEVIVVFIPSMRQLFRVLRENNIYIDTQDKNTKAFIRKCYFLANEKDMGVDERLNLFRIDATLDTKISDLEKRVRKLESKNIDIGTKVTCTDYGDGEVITLFSDDLMLVQFKDREFRTMCNREKMCTVHDKKRRKLELV